MDNVIVTPHSLCWTDECFHNMAWTGLTSIVDASLGRRPQFVVNPDVLDHPRVRAWLTRVIARLSILAALSLFALDSQAFDLQGHRGARGLAPENTLAAFRRALDDRRHDDRDRSGGHARRRRGDRPRSAAQPGPRAHPTDAG